MRTKIQKGLCYKENCDGFLQYDKKSELVFCTKCDFRMAECDFEVELEEAYNNEYHEPQYEENLNKLNQL